MNLENGNERPVESVEILAVARALLGQYLTAGAGVFVFNVSAELSAEQMHSEHATAQHSAAHLAHVENKTCVPVCAHIHMR